MNERRSRCRVIADAAALQAHRGGAERLERNAGDVEVDGLAERVLAVSRHAAFGAAAAEHVVGGGRAVAADDLDRFLGSDLLIDLPEQIDLFPVHRGGFVLAPVTHDPVDLLQRLFVVLPILLEGDGQAFVGVDVVQVDGAGVAHRPGALHPNRAGEEQTGGETGAIHRTRNAQPKSGMLLATNSHVRSRPHGVAKRQNNGSPRLAAAVTWLTQSYRDGLMRNYCPPAPDFVVVTIEYGEKWPAKSRWIADMVKGRMAESGLFEGFSVDFEQFPQ